MTMMPAPSMVYECKSCGTERTISSWTYAFFGAPDACEECGGADFYQPAVY